jgi:hypothetical protein
MTASPPKVNGHVRPPAPPVLGDWQPIDATPTVQDDAVTEPAATVEADSDLIAQAQAEAIRSKAWAEAEEQRLAAEAKKEAALKLAEAEAEAIRIKAEEDARKAKIANDRAEARFEEEQAARQARIAQSNKEREDAERAAADANRQAEEEQRAEADQTKAVEKSSRRWRWVAMSFYGLCAAVALPVQMAAFYNPNAKYLLVAPLFIEVIALVALVGAAAAVTDGRPQWHYRLVAWAGALTAATINVVHGLGAFDAATAFGTALASVAGPGMWDLHEHGRIRKRDGKPAWRERRAAKKAAKAEEKQRALDEKRRAAEKEAAAAAEKEARRQLADDRRREFEDVWQEAVKIAAAVGSTTDDDAVWERAYRNIKGCEPGESIESITARNKAEARVQAALTGAPVNTVSKTTNAQRAIQMNSSSRRSSYRPVPPRRTPGDTPSYHPLARRANGETKRRINAAKKDPS